MKTYYGTYTDINESDIYCIFNKYKLFFTSSNTKNKFLKNVDEFINIETIKMKNRYNLDIDLSDYLAIVFYKKLQKKGFRVEVIGINEKIINFNFKVNMGVYYESKFNKVES